MNWNLAPDQSEYDPYYHMYVSLVPEGDLLGALARERDVTFALLDGLTDEQAVSRYEPGKWSVKEVVGHLIDTERVFAYRALTFARGDTGPLPSMEQDDWARASQAHDRSIQSLASEFRDLRNANIAMWGGFTSEEGLRRGVGSGKEFSVRALAFITCGHEIHHIGVIRDRYLQG